MANYLILALGLFCIGLFGLLTRRDAIGMLLSVELMANGANITLVSFSWWHHAQFGQVFALFSMALTVVEVAAGLALLLLLFRTKRDISVDALRELKG